MNQAFKWFVPWALVLVLNISSQGQNNAPVSLAGQVVTHTSGSTVELFRFIDADTVLFYESPQDTNPGQQQYSYTSSGSSGTLTVIFDDGPNEITQYAFTGANTANYTWQEVGTSDTESGTASFAADVQSAPDSLVGTRVLVQATANDGYKENVDYFFGPSTVRYKYSDEEVTESYVATKSGSSYVVSLGSGDLLNLSFSTLTTGSGTYEDRESFSFYPGPSFQWLGGNLYKDLKGSGNLTFTVFVPQMGLLLTPFAPPEVTDLTKQLAMPPGFESNGTRSLMLADIDGDGDLDVVTESKAGNFVTNQNKLGSFDKRMLLMPSPSIPFRHDAPVGEKVASLAVFDSTDPEGDDSYTYSLAAGSGDGHNSFFAVDQAGQVSLAGSPPDGNLSIRVKVSKATGLEVTKSFQLSKLPSQIEQDKVPFAVTQGFDTLGVKSVLLKGNLLLNGNGTNLQVGFLWGKRIILSANTPGTTRIVSTLGAGTSFSSTVQVRELGLHYYRTFAQNEFGETLGPLRRFHVGGQSANNSALSPWLSKTGSSAQVAGWTNVPWFGQVMIFPNNWIFHREMGWMYSHPDASDGVWLWTKQFRWMWTKDSVFPYLYRSSDAEWLYFMTTGGTNALMYEWNARKFTPVLR